MERQIECVFTYRNPTGGEGLIERINYPLPILLGDSLIDYFIA